jgi:hypothetical protein
MLCALHEPLLFGDKLVFCRGLFRAFFDAAQHLLFHHKRAQFIHKVLIDHQGAQWSSDGGDVYRYPKGNGGAVDKFSIKGFSQWFYQFFIHNFFIISSFVKNS